jgi:hypothetical protein
VNAYHVCGVLFAVWAVIVSFLGITREDFPGNAARLVGLVSVLLALATIGSAVYTGITEEEEEEGGEHEAALVLPS